MTLLILVPARGGSKRLPGKNLRPLAGHSLLERTAWDITASGLDAPCLLTTDDEAIAEAGRGLGWMVPFLRPAALATDAAPTITAVLHALDWYAQHHREPETIMLLQVTSPFRGSQCLHRAVAMLEARRDVDAVVAMRTVAAAPEHVYVRGAEDLAASLGHSDRTGPVLAPNGALYLVRSKALRAHGSLFPLRMVPLVMTNMASLDIDTPEDWSLAESTLAARPDDARKGGE